MGELGNAEHAYLTGSLLERDSVECSYMKTPAKTPKTRILSDDQVRERFRCGCPACGAQLASFSRSVTDERTGKKRSGGSFIGCSKYGKTCFAKYNLSVETNRETIV